MDDRLDLAADPDRARGILTPSDREFLLGRKTDYTDHSRKQKRNRIRRRVRNAILDWSIVATHLETRDRQTVFDLEADERESYTNGMADALAFFYLGADDSQIPFTELLTRGVSRAEQNLAGSAHRVVTVDFGVERVSEVDGDAVIDTLEDGRLEELTEEELRGFARLLADAPGVSLERLREDLAGQLLEFSETEASDADALEHRPE
ncbi:hypothetical protein [Natronobiforma cellulositropha]|uniref:hypothetical protein n=1 Tax=Natronobiforma cellulositropha TaxID=1679076 RepID=UPI0021D5BA5B|nr:hypothetical protein [Natronobiforma cellulositropha]